MDLNYTPSSQELEGWFNTPEPQLNPPIRAWRSFIVENGKLYSLAVHRDRIYESNVIYKATCIHSNISIFATPVGHSAPEINCTCGFYAFKNRKNAISYARPFHSTTLVEVWLGGKIVGN